MVDPASTQPLDLTEIRWIAFDAVGTLIHPEPPVPSIYHAVGARHGSLLGEDEIGRRFKQAFDESHRPSPGDEGLQTSEDVERDRWRSIVGRVMPDVGDADACFDELFNHFARPGSWMCFPEVGGILQSLKAAGYRLALASNFDDRLTGIVHGLLELSPLDAVVISSLVGFRKPSPLFYHALIETAGCRAGELLMVGDDLRNDVEGARAAGLQAIHLDRDAGETLQTLKALGLLLI